MELVTNTTNITASLIAIQLLSSTSNSGVAYYHQGEIKITDTQLNSNDLNTFDIMLASERVLSREWDNPEEDEAWAHL